VQALYHQVAMGCQLELNQVAHRLREGRGENSLSQATGGPTLAGIAVGHPIIIVPLSLVIVTMRSSPQPRGAALFLGQRSLPAPAG